MNTRRADPAFTLIELMVVIVILSVTTAGVGLSLAHTVQRSGFDAQTDRAAWIDRQSRSLCLNHGRTAALTFDLVEQTIGRSEYHTLNPHDETLLDLPPNTRLDRFVTTQINQSTGRYNVPISDQGHSQTYGLRFTSAEQSIRWLIFCGQTGQTLAFEDDRRAHAFFEMLAGNASNGVAFTGAGP